MLIILSQVIIDLLKYNDAIILKFADEVHLFFGRHFIISYITFEITAYITAVILATVLVFVIRNFKPLKIKV
jgi:ABC-type multidrug transport system permease subunit